MMEMDHGNCFQLLDSQASISDQLYCHTMSSYAIHIYNTHVPYTCQHSHKEWWSPWSRTSINYWLLCSTVSYRNLAAASKGIDQALLVMEFSSRQAMTICTREDWSFSILSDSSETSILIPAILHQQTTRTAAACIGGWGWVRCALFRVCSTSVQFWLLVAIELAFQVNSSWREVRRQLPPLQLCSSWRFEVSGCGFPTRPLQLCMEQWKSKLITWKKGGFVRTRTNPPVSATG